MARSEVVAESDGVTRHADGSARRIAPALLLAAAIVDPLAFVQPTVRVQPAERDALSRGAAFARDVSAPPRHVASVAVITAWPSARHDTRARPNHSTRSLMSLVRDGERRSLVYVNQSSIDLLDACHAGILRGVVERRVREEAVDVSNGLRRRLERGDPAHGAQ